MKANSELSKRVLYAEDHKLVRRSTARCLTTQGWSVESCADGSEALEHLKQNGDYVLVISDIEMPKLSGIELASIIAQEFSELPVLLLSGNPQKISEFQAPLPKRLEFLAKPFSAEDLALAVQQIMNPCE